MMPVILNNKDNVKTTTIKMLLFTLLVLVLFFGFSSAEFGRSLMFAVNQLLKYLIGYSVEFVSTLFSGSVIFDHTRFLLTNGASLWSIFTIERTYPVYLIAVLLTVFIPARKIITGLVYIILTVSFIVLCCSLLTFFRVYLNGTIHYVWSLPIEKSVFLPLYFWIFYIAKKNEILTDWLYKLNSKMLHISYFTIQKFLLILILFNAFPFVILRYLGDSIPFMTSALLKVSQIILSTAGYNTNIIGNQIFLDENWIKIYPSCIGVGLWVLVVFMIVNMRGNLMNKIIYVPVFTLFFSITNSFRIAYALLEIHHQAKVQMIDYVGLHNNITYIMYIVSFTFLIIYIFWFHNLKFVNKLKSH